MADVTIAGIAVGVGLSTLGSWLGWWGATRNQERQHLRSQQSIARALREDIARIRSEMHSSGKSALETDGFYVAGVTVPTIHPWVESGIIQVADAAPSAVGLLMRAERELSNMRVFARQIDQRRAELESEMALHAELEKKNSTLDSLGDDLIGEWKAQHNVKQIEKALEQLQFMYGLFQKDALEAIEQADKELAGVIARPLPDWLPAVD